MNNLESLEIKPPVGHRWNAAGNPTTLRKPEPGWISMHQAAKLLHMSSENLYTLSKFAQANGLRHKPRSMVAKSCRGSGILWYQPDIERLLRIKLKVRVSILNAIRIFGALHRGDI